MAKANKLQLRKQFLQKRDHLDSVVRARDSAIIRQRLFQQRSWAEARTVLTYVSFGSEVETHKLIQEALEQSKRVVVPIINHQKKNLDLSELHHLGDLAPGPFRGMYEPSPLLRKQVRPHEVELVLVPGVVFDRWGGRIGFGGGYFDKLLPLMPDALRWGLAFSLQVLRRHLPLRRHDIRMHAVITENELLEIGRDGVE